MIVHCSRYRRAYSGTTPYHSCDVRCAVVRYLIAQPAKRTKIGSFVRALPPQPTVMLLLSQFEDQRLGIFPAKIIQNLSRCVCEAVALSGESLDLPLVCPCTIS